MTSYEKIGFYQNEVTLFQEELNEVLAMSETEAQDYFGTDNTKDEILKAIREDLEIACAGLKEHLIECESFK